MSMMKKKLHSARIKDMHHEQPGDRSPVHLSKQERRVSSLAEQDPLRFATSTAAQIAELTSTSEATVARTARKLGFAGTKEFKLSCAERIGQTQSLGGVIRSRLQNLPSDGFQTGPEVTASVVLTSAADLLIRLSDSLDPALVSSVVEALTSARRVTVYGLGTGYRIAQYFCLELERIGIDALALTGGGHLNADAVPRVTSDDELLIIAPLLIFPDVRSFMEVAAGRARAVTVISQDHIPAALSGTVRHIRLPTTSSGPASESVAAWALCDVLVAEIARRHPERAIDTRNYVQQLRERFSPS